APFMAERVMGAVAYQYQEALRVPHLERSVGERLRELAAGRVGTLERTVFFVPEGFKRVFKPIFRDLYERLHGGLDDKTRVHNALVEVTSDFLSRCGPGLEGLEGHHRVFLYELCDRTLAAENGGRAPRRALASAGDGPPGGEARLGRMYDDVIRCVEQDL